MRRSRFHFFRAVVLPLILIACVPYAALAFPPASNAIFTAYTAFLSPNGSVGRSLIDRYNERANLLDFGAKGAGADDTAAIQAWLASSATDLYAPAGNFIFKTPVARSSGGFALRGAGPTQTVFTYAGTDATPDILTIGSDSAQSANVQLRDFRIASTTKMTAGTALHVENLGRSDIFGVIADGRGGNGNLWNGVWFDRIDNVRYYDFQITAQNDGERVNGTVGSGPKANLFMRGGLISGAAVGLRVGGAFGGLTVDDSDIIGNGINMVIDTTLAGEANRELFFKAGTFFDSSTTGPNVQISDKLGGLANYITFANPWLSNPGSTNPGTQPNLLIDAGVGSTVTLTGGRIGSGSTGIQNNSTGKVLLNGTLMAYATGPAFSAATLLSNASYVNPIFASNGSNFDTNSAPAVTFYNVGGTMIVPGLLNANGGVRYGSGDQFVYLGGVETHIFGGASNYFETWDSANLRWRRTAAGNVITEQTASYNKVNVPTLSSSAARVALTTSGYTVPATSDLVRFVQTATLASATVTLPTAVGDTQPIEFDNYSGAVTALTFSPAVTGWINGSQLSAPSTVKIRWDSTLAAWQRVQ